MLKKPFLLLLFLCFGVKAFSAVFVVTSNADSGPGTLRDALTQAAANGNTEKDYINFNLPDLSEAGRTITLLSNLPTINSDMIIDGSTQPGTPLSVNGAKVIIGGSYYDPNSYINYFYIENVNSLEIDGLIIKGFYSNYNNFTGVQVFIVGGNNKSIKLGQPGKGNVIYNCSQSLEFTVGEGAFPNKSSTDSLILKNNLIGIEEDGVTIAENIQSGTTANYVSNIVLGGETKAEGNVFYGLMSLSPVYYNDVLKSNSSIYIKNNIFGANSQEKRTNDPLINTDWNSFYLTISAYYQDTGPYSSSIQITNNVFGYEVSVSGYQTLNMTMQHNYFGVSEDQQNSLPIKAAALTLNYMKGTMLIGGSDTSKGNVFAHCAQDSTDSFNLPGVVEVTDITTTLNPAFKIELSHNSFYCNNSYPFFYALAPDKKPLSVTVDDLTATSVDGTTSQPNARVELFYTDKECTQCQPKTYLATTYADASGKWTYNGSLLAGYGVMAGATYNQTSSEFTDTRIYAPLESGGYPTVTGAECDLGGSILGFYTVNAKKVEWLNSNNQVVGTNINLVNVPAGEYRLEAEQFGCITYSQNIEIQDYTPKIDSQNVHIISPSCGVGGSISNLNLAYYASYSWLDSTGKTISNQLDISNLSAGSYTLQVIGQRGCVKTYGPVTLKNTTGPNIDQGHTKVQSTNCGQTTGSITNIPATGTGALKYSWVNNSTQQTVGTDSILVNQPAGTYKLQVTDDTQCGPVYSSDINIPETNGISIDTSKLLVTPSSCGIANGSVINLQATGATSYQWVNANGNVVNASANLTNATAGKYTFTASNSFGCSRTLIYTIPQLATTKLPDYAAKITTACNTANTGGIAVATDGLVKSARWADSTGTTIGTSSTLTQIFAGNYQLYLTDQNGCESFYKSYTVPSYPEFTIANYGTTSADECNLNNGAVSATTMAGGVPPYSYKWTDLNGNQLSTDNAKNNLTAGDYYLFITDAGGCGSVRITYTIPASTELFPAPSVSDVQLCSSGSGLITVNNASASNNYRLYNSPTAAQPIDEQKGGRFTINVTANSTYYVSEVNGSCESNRTQVNVTVGISTINIANAFTPNGDGINDYWQITGIESYPTALVQIFNRYGQKVFESKGYSIPFDGTYKGQKLPSGVYYYIVNLNTNCNLLSGSLTIVR